MTFTYNPTSLSTDLAKVRHLIRDVDANRPLFQDEELAFHISSASNVYLAAAEACEALAAMFGRKVDRSAIGISDSPQDTAEFYLDLAKRLRERGQTSSSGGAAYALCDVFAGGRSVQGKIDLATDEDATQPAFDIGADDNINTGAQDSTSGRYQVGE